MSLSPLASHWHVSRSETEQKRVKCIFLRKGRYYIPVFLASDTFENMEGGGLNPIEPPQTDYDTFSAMLINSYAAHYQRH